MDWPPTSRNLVIPQTTLAVSTPSLTPYVNHLRYHDRLLHDYNVNGLRGCGRGGQEGHCIFQCVKKTKTNLKNSFQSLRVKSYLASDTGGIRTALCLSLICSSCAPAPCLLSALHVFRLRCWACSVCPSFWILRAWFHHRILPDPASHQLRGTADTQVWEWLPCCHPAGHAPQPPAGGLLHCQAGGGVPGQHVCGTHQRWDRRSQDIRTDFLRHVRLNVFQRLLCIEVWWRLCGCTYVNVTALKDQPFVGLWFVQTCFMQSWWRKEEKKNPNVLFMSKWYLNRSHSVFTPFFFSSPILYVKQLKWCNLHDFFVLWFLGLFSSTPLWGSW